MEWNGRMEFHKPMYVFLMCLLDLLYNVENTYDDVDIKNEDKSDEEIKLASLKNTFVNPYPNLETKNEAQNGKTFVPPIKNGSPKNNSNTISGTLCIFIPLKYFYTE